MTHDPDQPPPENDSAFYQPQDPIERFRALLQRAQASEPLDGTAVALATCTPSGEPSVRMVLLKGVPESHDSGFQFFTNYESRKAAELRQNPRAALCFHWPTLASQVRVEGRVEVLPTEESDAYFASRHRSSQLAAWSSRQSSSLVSRQVLLKRYHDLEGEHAGQPVPRPPFWGGYRIVPERIEFWQGVEYRLHHRLRYTWDGLGWRSEALYP